MRYSIEPRDRIYVKGYGFLSFAKNIGKSLSNKYGQKLLNSSEKSTTDAIKTAWKRAIQKTAEATGDLIGNKIVVQITSVSKRSPMKLHSAELRSKELQNGEMEQKKKRYISPEERQEIIDELRLILKRMYISRNYWWIRVSIKRKIHISWTKATNYWLIKVAITI